MWPCRTSPLPGGVITKILDSLLSSTQIEIDTTLRDMDTDDRDLFMAHKSALEMYAFLILWVCIVAEKTGDAEEASAKAKACLSFHGLNP